MAMNNEENSWRKSIMCQLQERNKTQTQCFQDLITFHNRLFDNANALRVENLQLSIQNEKLRLSATNVDVPSSPGISGENRVQEQKLQGLEQKLLAQQEELTELHRRKGENAQQIIDLNKKLLEKEKQLTDLDVSLADNMSITTSLRAEIRMFQNSIRELENLNQVLRDEHQALQLAFAALEDKLRKAQDENRQMVERLIKYKSKDAEKMNEENENFLKKRQAKMQKELEEAAKDTRSVSPDTLKDNGSNFFTTALPSNAAIKFDAHDGEVNAVKWSPADRIVATGGADRKVKLWDVSKGVAKSWGVLVGSNAGVMSVDFDSTGTLCLGASNDFASRVWTVSDQRLKHTLTGHSGKVMAAKFLGEPSKIVTGSHDRTLKIWDLRSRACTETKFAGSSCNDLVTSDGSGSTIISGHFDKRIRFWDTRADSCANDIVLQGKVTSLDLTRDCNYLVACVRDDTLKLLDLRMNKIIVSFSCDGFKVGCDWSRATFSPDGQYIAVGSSDGGVYVWSISSAKVEVILKEHSAAVTATSWNPHGSFLISVDKAKKAVIWSEV